MDLARWRSPNDVWSLEVSRASYISNIYIYMYVDVQSA